MYKTIIIGAGQIGSRHLQALKLVKYPLEITVVDPNSRSLDTARQRYESAPQNKPSKKIRFRTTIPANNNFYLGIVATNSNMRAQVVKNFIKTNKVRYLVLEKILFDKKKDYAAILKLLKKNKIKPWVNCPMRVMPFYKKINNEFKKEKIVYMATGSKWGLITDLIHYLDHMAFITGVNNFKLNTDGLDKKIYDSKRKGFKELQGTISAVFKDGSYGMFTYFKEGKLPIVVQAHSKKIRFIYRESEGKVWISCLKDNWAWREQESPILYQSQLTNTVTESIIKSGKCDLPTFEESSKTHLQMLEQLNFFLNKIGSKKHENYPFT